jgi:hypothetical protein
MNVAWSKTKLKTIEAKRQRLIVQLSDAKMAYQGRLGGEITHSAQASPQAANWTLWVTNVAPSPAHVEDD